MKQNYKNVLWNSSSRLRVNPSSGLFYSLIQQMHFSVDTTSEMAIVSLYFGTLFRHQSEILNARIFKNKQWIWFAHSNWKGFLILYFWSAVRNLQKADQQKIERTLLKVIYEIEGMAKKFRGLFLLMFQIVAFSSYLYIGFF